MENLALLARLVAKPGKETELESFLKGALPLAIDEPDTLKWYALKIDERTFGIFDTFADEQGIQAHLSGPIAKVLLAKADEYLAQPPVIEKAELIAVKP